jgi:hypothetical protein
MVYCLLEDAVDVIAEIASNEVLDLAYSWLCRQRRGRHANHDVWDVRWWWHKLKPRLQARLVNGTYRFEAVQRYRLPGETVEAWSSLDSMVLKAVAIVLLRRLESHLSDRCYHLVGHGGAKAVVREVAGRLPENSFVFRSDVKSYCASIDHEILFEQLRRQIGDQRLLDLLWSYLRRTIYEDGFTTM